MKKIAFYGAVLLAGALVAHADTLITNAPVPTDTLSWSQLGSDGASIPNSFDFTTDGGVTGEGQYQGTGSGEVAVANGSNWVSTNFPTGDFLNFTEGNGPLTLTFDQNYYEMGAEIQSDDFGAFVAGICDSNGSCFSEDSDLNGDAMYIGIQSEMPFDSLTFDLLYSSEGDVNSFAIDSVNLVSTPEPNALLLLGSGLVLLGLIKFRKRGQAAIRTI